MAVNVAAVLVAAFAAVVVPAAGGAAALAEHAAALVVAFVALVADGVELPVAAAEPAVAGVVVPFVAGAAALAEHAVVPFADGAAVPVVAFAVLVVVPAVAAGVVVPSVGVVVPSVGGVAALVADAAALAGHVAGPFVVAVPAVAFAALVADGAVDPVAGAAASFAAVGRVVDLAVAVVDQLAVVVPVAAGVVVPFADDVAASVRPIAGAADRLAAGRPVAVVPSRHPCHPGVAELVYCLVAVRPAAAAAGCWAVVRCFAVPAVAGVVAATVQNAAGANHQLLAYYRYCCYYPEYG